MSTVNLKAATVKLTVERKGKNRHHPYRSHHASALLFGRAVRNAAAVILALSARCWNRIEYPTLPTLPANRKRETGKVYRITLHTPPRSYSGGRECKTPKRASGKGIKG